MKKIIQFLKNYHLQILMSVFVIGIGILALFDMNDNVKFDEMEKEYYKNYYLRMGKNIGRNAMIKYLHETNELDSNVTINIKKLLKIEKNIENKKLKKRNNE